MTDLDKAREELEYQTHQGDRYDVRQAADAIIAALEAEVERLKVCGNCRHWSDFDLCAVGGHDNFMGNDACHFTPSRWQRREP